MVKPRLTWFVLDMSPLARVIKSASLCTMPFINIYEDSPTTNRSTKNKQNLLYNKCAYFYLSMKNTIPTNI